MVKPSSCPSQLCQWKNEGWGWDPLSCHPASNDGNILGEHLKKRTKKLDKVINRIPRSESELLGIFLEIPFKITIINHHVGWISNQRVFNSTRSYGKTPTCHDDCFVVILPHGAEPRKALEDGRKVEWVLGGLELLKIGGRGSWKWLQTNVLPSREVTYPGPKNGMLKMIFLFPRWDMFVPWRVYVKTIEKRMYCKKLTKYTDTFCGWASSFKALCKWCFQWRASTVWYGSTESSSNATDIPFHPYSNSKWAVATQNSSIHCPYSKTHGWW